MYENKCREFDARQRKQTTNKCLFPKQMTKAIFLNKSQVKKHFYVPPTLKTVWTISPKMVIKAGEMKLNLSLNALLFRHNGGVFSVSASASPCAWISYLECFQACFSFAVSLIKNIINYCYWQSYWILFHSRNIHINALAEAEPDISGILRFSLSQNMKHLYFLNETIPSQIASSNS